MHFEKWKVLNDESQLEHIKEASKIKPVLIFKHSTTCTISLMAKKKFENSWKENLDAYYLDLLTYRSISNKIADIFQVQHESPQVLLIFEGVCIYDESHLDISSEEIEHSAAIAMK